MNKYYLLFAKNTSLSYVTINEPMFSRFCDSVLFWDE